MQNFISLRYVETTYGTACVQFRKMFIIHLKRIFILILLGAMFYIWKLDELLIKLCKSLIFLIDFLGILKSVSENSLKYDYVFVYMSSKSCFSSIQFSCPTLCDPTDCSTPGFPVHHQLLELAQTHVQSCSLILLCLVFIF